MSDPNRARRPLYLTSGDGAPVELPRAGKLVIGSDPDRAGFVLESRGVADVHCAIGRIKSGGWAIMDLGSDAGTWVNDERVETRRVVAGDEVRVGDATLRVVRASTLEAGPTRAAEAAAPPSQGAATAAGQGAAEDRTAPGGRELGGYRLEKQLGRGAMGDVHLAVQTSLDRRVALKVLKPALARDARFVERFQREARAAARLNHPNIVTAYDVGEDGGAHFLSLEYMEGGSLQSRLRSAGRLPWPMALDAVIDAAKGLVYAEGRGIVHRDIKPDNLMLGADGEVKIADLGLAVQVEQEDGVDGERGKVFGTPHFLAPELLRGEKPTTSSDLYALGTTAYQLIAGRTPFDGADPKRIARAILDGEAPPLGGVVVGVPAPVERIVHRLMAKDPSERPASAREALEELEAARAAAGGGGARGRGVLIAALAALALGAGAWALTLGGEDGADGGGGSAAVRDGGTGVADADPGGAGGQGVEDPTTSNGSDGTGPSSGDSTGANVEVTAPPPEEALERQAQRALAKVGDEDLTDGERVARLRAVAAEFRGTDAAREAEAAADALENAAEANAEEAAALAEQRGVYEAALRTAAGDGSRTPVEALRGIAGVPLPGGDLANDPRALALRSELIEAALERGALAIEAALARADAAEEELDYAATREALLEAAAIETLPPGDERPPEIAAGGTPPPALTRLQELERAAAERAEAIESRAEEFAEARRRRARAEVAGNLGEGLLEDLGALAIEAAAARVGEAGASASDPALSAALQDSAAALRGADAALDALMAALESGDWRRRSVRDPRRRDGSRMEVLSFARPAAVLVEGEDGGQVRVELSRFGGHTEALADLFEPRTSSDWTRAEAAAIAELLAATATLEATRSLRPALAQGGRRPTFGEREREAALAPFEEALRWRTDHDGVKARVERARAAVAELCAALEDRANGDLASSVTRLRRLLREQRDTFLVMFLSDGGAR